MEITNRHQSIRYGANGVKFHRLIALLPALVLCPLPNLVTAAENVDSEGNSEQVTFVRLTSSQYRNTIHDIFGESIRIGGNAVSGGVREAGLMAVGC